MSALAWRPGSDVLLVPNSRGGIWLLGSAWLRIGLLLAAFYWISDGRWERLLACLLGFVAIRFATTRWAARGGAKRPAG